MEGINTDKSSEVGGTQDVSTIKSSTVKDHSGEVPGVKPDPNLTDPWRTVTKGDN